MAAAAVVLSADAGGSNARVETAILAAVKARMGSAAEVSIRTLTAVRVQAGDAPLVATPEPGGRVGRPVRFTLALASPDEGGARVGEAFAIVDVDAEVVRTRRPIARGAIVKAPDVESGTGRLDGLLFRVPPSAASVIGGRATRDLADGDLVTDTAIAVVPPVRAGGRVRVVFRSDRIDLSSSAIALETGFACQVIRVANAETRRSFRARVIGPEEVEVVDGW